MRFSAVLLFSALALFVARADAALIDDFDDGGGTVTAAAAGTDSDSSDGSPGTVGDERDLDIPGVVGDPVSGIGSLTMSANPASSGVLSFSLDALTSGSAKLTWDGVGDPGPGLGGFDLTDLGVSTHIQFDILSIDQGDVDLTVTVEDTSGEVSSLTVSDAGVGEVQFPFVAFSGSADFSDADVIMLEIDGVDGSDLVLDQFFSTTENVIPEPSTFLLGILAVLSFGVTGFRRRRVMR